MNSSPFFAPISRTQSAPRILARVAVLPEPPFSLRRRRALCIGFLLVWPAFYAGRAQSAPTQSGPKPMTLRVGKSATFPLPAGARWFIEEGAANANVDSQNGAFAVRGVASGNLRLRIQKSDGSFDRLAFRFVAPGLASSGVATGDLRPAPVSTAPSSPSPARTPTRMASSSAVDPLSQVPPIPSKVGFAPVSGTTSPASGSPAVGVNSATAPAGFPNGGARINPPAGFPNGQTVLAPTLPAPSGVNSAPTGGILSSPPDSPNNLTPSLPDAPPASSNPNLPRPAAPRPNTNTLRPGTSTPRPPARPPVLSSPPAGGPQVLRPLPPAPAVRPSDNGQTTRTPRISPTLPSPSRTTTAKVSYPTTPRLPRGVATTGPRPGIEVTQGLARLVSFPENILSVFFSDPNVMDARAINARTIAVTGTGAGTSTLAVFTARYPGDAVGRANIYRVQTVGRGGAAAPALGRNPQVVETAITAALGDPRVRTTVVRLPDGTLAARLTGTLRNAAEVEGAKATAEFYVSRVISSLYSDTAAPTIDAVLSGTSSVTPEGALQDNLRRLTGNASIELVNLPGGMALKAEANSPEEAEAILRVLPSIGQPVLPFIVLRGQANTQNPYYQSQALQGEDRVLTERLRLVTGVSTVTVVRASPNSIAIYGTVLTRGDLETVKRYGTILAQAAAGSLRPTGAEVALPAYDPASGYLRPLGVQMFVRILDPAQATIRNVTVETSIVEISRTALRNLGVQFGSSSLTGETSAFDAATGVTTVNRTINPAFNPGVALAGNGFAGFGRSGPNGPLGFIDPFRAQLNALAQRGDARVLSRPNVRTVEGMPAQITIGGERPVPSAVATTGATAQSVEFRRFGVIISMRPTVSDDNTILLQIRADITQPDRTFEINLNGALIPGESVRSIDTNIAVRPGDTIIMGGLITNEKRQQTTKVPLLGDLPIIGALFKSKRFENNETELAIFMQPRIDFLPASPTTEAFKDRWPSFPSLPSRQESNGILFQPTTRAPG